jgi:hypothetical protein
MATQLTLPQFRSAQMGLLTTVADLPPDIKKQYIFTFNTSTTTFQSPLDLSVKPFVFSASDYHDPPPPPITPPCTPSPLKKRYREEYEQLEKDNQKAQKLELELREKTPNKPVKCATTPPKSSKKRTNSDAAADVRPAKEPRKTKAVRKLKFDEYTSSPVSGTIIRSIDEINSNSPQESGDIDPEYNILEVTDEVKAELAAIPNVIGGYSCKLCRQEFDDCFGLARHRCSCIVLLDYLCPECGKRFNCPANLASHRRWHKPRDQVMKKSDTSETSDLQYPCSECGKVFKRQAYLKKHLLTHKVLLQTNQSSINNNSEENSNQNLTETHSNYHFESNSNSKDFPIKVETYPFSTDSLVHEMPQTVFKYEYYQNVLSNRRYNSVGDDENNSNLSTASSASSTQLQIVTATGRFTEDENLAAAALAHLRNGVIRHTTALAV